jgi:predicted NAD/FAD-binding protein
VGAGIAGLGSAWLLRKQGHAVTVYEAADYLGGHTHTVDVTLAGVSAPVDTGFLVFNDRTYPALTALFAEIGVESVASEMSFSARIDGAGVEWAGTNLPALFAQPRNAILADFWRMLRDILRFNRDATGMAMRDDFPRAALRDYLDDARYSRPFREWYLLPMAAAIWSSPRRDVESFGVETFVRFCHNHGLLALANRPQWRTVAGGARTYVERIAAHLPDIRLATPVARIRREPRHIDVEARDGVERFDAVVLACHSDQALALLSDPSPLERQLLSAIRYQPNRAVLHTDTSLLPSARRAWSAWNFLACDDPQGIRPVAVSYLINRLQPLPFATPVIVTLNPPFDPAPGAVLREFEYDHPLLDWRAVGAQRQFPRLQGERRTWYAGAWLGYGFHEDGLLSAHAVAEGIARCADEHDELARQERAAA